MIRCHECYCHSNPPCDNCVDCRHWEHPDCPEPCDICEEHKDA